MRIVVCVKEVLDPDAVDAYALSGGLVIGEDGISITQATIPRLINGYDEQAVEAALRIRDAGTEATISVVSVGSDQTAVLRATLAIGADDVTSIEPPASGADDYHVVAALLAAYVRSSGGADLVLCGRQASDDDQGVVPALIAAELDAPVVTVAREITVHDGADGPNLRVVRATPEGSETVEVRAPAVVTVSNELGEPRYPTMPQKRAARKVTPDVVTAAELGVDDAALEVRARLRSQFVPTIKGDCEMISGENATAVADALVTRLIEDKVLRSR